MGQLLALPRDGTSTHSLGVGEGGGDFHTPSAIQLFLVVPLKIFLFSISVPYPLKLLLIDLYIARCLHPISTLTSPSSFLSNLCLQLREGADY